MCTVQELMLFLCFFSVLDLVLLSTLTERAVFPSAVNTDDMGQAGAHAKKEGTVLCH